MIKNNKISVCDDASKMSSSSTHRFINKKINDL